jgi:hypothetical protein
VSGRLSIALLTEDRSEGTRRGLQAILEKLLRRFEDDGFTPRNIKIVPPDDNVRPILVANRWESGELKDASRKRELWTYIARVISEPGGFVVFHYDGDVLWPRRTTSLRPAKFDREIRTRVAQVLRTKGLSDDEVARRLRRLIECVPFYSVEAWLYQATTRAIALCKERYRGADVEKFAAWGADRALLDDEVSKPKGATCLQDKHNEELGRHVPVWEVARAGRSLMGFVWALHACADLEDALAPRSS